jgi:hypothetical protein
VDAQAGFQRLNGLAVLQNDTTADPMVSDVLATMENQRTGTNSLMMRINVLNHPEVVDEHSSQDLDVHDHQQHQTPQAPPFPTVMNPPERSRDKAVQAQLRLSPRRLVRCSLSSL